MYKFLFALLLFCTPLQSCKITQGAFYETTKAFTKAQIKQFFPESNLEKDSIYLAGEFAPEKVQKILKEEACKFLTAQGETGMRTLNFLAYVSWKRTSTGKVRITITYYKNKAQSQLHERNH